MTPRERLFARLNGAPVDRVPNLSILMMFAARYLGQPFAAFCRDYRVLVAANLRCNEAFGIDLLHTMSDAYRETFDFGAQVDFPADDLPLCMETLLRDTADLAKLRSFDPWESTRMLDSIRAIEMYKREAGNYYPILGWVEGPIAEMADLRGLSQTLAGADIIGIGDAAASIISPEQYRAKVLPFEQQLVIAIHDAGAKVKLHICGDITHLLDDVGRTGADIIDVDWMVDIPIALARWPAHTVINGNFDPVAVMLQGTPDAVRRAVRRNLSEGGDRLCVSPGCEVPRDTPYENLLALQEALESAGTA